MLERHRVIILVELFIRIKKFKIWILILVNIFCLTCSCDFQHFNRSNQMNFTNKKLFLKIVICIDCLISPKQSYKKTHFVKKVISGSNIIFYKYYSIIKTSVWWLILSWYDLIL